MDTVRRGIRALPTLYEGIRYRSRLEARWAIFFRALGVFAQYEPEGFVLGRVWYLPDFHIPHWKAFVEIKPTAPTTAERDQCRALAEGTCQDCLLIWGEPQPRQHSVLRFEFDPLGLGEFVLEEALAASEFAPCAACPEYWLVIGGEGDMWCSELGPHSCGPRNPGVLLGHEAPRVRAAYEAARTARFSY